MKKFLAFKQVTFSGKTVLSTIDKQLLPYYLEMFNLQEILYIRWQKERIITTKIKTVDIIGVLELE